MNNLSEIVGRSLNKDPSKPTKSSGSSSKGEEFTQSLQAVLKGMETAGAGKLESVAHTIREDELATVHQVTATVDEAAKTLDQMLETKRLLLARLDQIKG
jgi:hypothetical protein